MICPLTGLKASKIGKNRIGVYVPTHPKANNRGYVLRYRYIVEQYLNRYLTEQEEIHHINGNKCDDRLDNLQIISCSEHTKLHMKQKNRRSPQTTKIIELMNSGLGYKKIAKLLNMSKNTVHSICKKEKKRTGVNRESTGESEIHHRLGAIP